MGAVTHKLGGKSELNQGLERGENMTEAIAEIKVLIKAGIMTEIEANRIMARLEDVNDIS